MFRSRWKVESIVVSVFVAMPGAPSSVLAPKSGIHRNPIKQLGQLCSTAVCLVQGGSFLPNTRSVKSQEEPPCISLQYYCSLSFAIAHFIYLHIMSSTKLLAETCGMAVHPKTPRTKELCKIRV